MEFHKYHKDELVDKIEQLIHLCKKFHITFPYTIYKELCDRNNEQPVGYSKFKKIKKRLWN